MAAPCKLQSSKLGKGTQKTSVLLKQRSITVRGVTAKRDSGNIPKRWKPRKPRNAWHSNHAPMFVRHAGPGGALRDDGAIGATGHPERVSGKIRGKRQRAGGKGVRRAGWTSWLVVEPRAHVFT